MRDYDIVGSDYQIVGRTEVIGYDDRVQLAGFAQDLSKVMREAGIKARTRLVDGCVVYELLVPTPRHNIVISARVMLPGEVWETHVGAGKVRRKLKAVGKKVASAAKKVANSKVVKKLARVVGPIAAVVPGLQPVAAGIALAAAAKKVVSAAKGGNPKAKQLLGAAVKGARIKLASTSSALTSSAPSSSARRIKRVTKRSYRVRAPDGQEASVSV